MKATVNFAPAGAFLTEALKRAEDEKIRRILNTILYRPSQN